MKNFLTKIALFLISTILISITLSSCSNNNGTSSTSQVQSSSAKTQSSLATTSSTNSTIPASNSTSSKSSSTNSASNSSTPQTSATENVLSLIDSGINYTETINNVINPDIGFQHMFRELVCDSATPTRITLEKVQRYMTTEDIRRNNFLVCFGLEYYSKSMKDYYTSNNDSSYTPYLTNGSEKAITSNGLKLIENALTCLRNAGATCVVRFSYDLSGVSYDNSFDCEPQNINLVYQHVQQIGTVVSKFRDTITAVEGGMFGPWGEQHTTTFGNDDNDLNYYNLTKTWLDNTPDDMFILLRRPKYIMYWYNHQYNTTYTTNNIDTIPLDFSRSEKRLGCYNDGYLGSSSDTGTYENRSKEVAFLKKLTYAPFGGEVLSNKLANNKEGIGQYNCVSFIEVEGFKTHTSFLNYSYDYENVISKWEANTYIGNDTIYKNNTSEFNYIFNHLGYRLVLREAKLNDTVQLNGTATFKGKIENVGFGSISKKQKVYLIITEKNKTSVLKKQLTTINMQDYTSQTKKDYNATISLQGLSSGDYSAYLKICNYYETENQEKLFIAFANNNVFNTTLNANYIGSFKIQ